VKIANIRLLIFGKCCEIDTRKKVAVWSMT